MSGLWSGAVMQPHQLHPLQHQQLQQQLMLGGHGNMGQLVGHQHQSPPGLGPLNMMIGGPVGGPGQHVSMGHMFPVQSPPSSTGQFLHLPQQQQQPRQIGDTVITPNSTPGLQTPTPSATPPIMNLDNRDNNLFHNRIVPGQDFEPIGDMDPMMGWRGLQALQQGGTIADMFPGVDRQFGAQLLGGAGGMERQNPGMEPRHPGPHQTPQGFPVSGFNNFSVAMAQAQQAQAAENMMRLQQLQQQNPDFLSKQQQHPQLPQFTAAHHLPGPEMTRHFPGVPPPQCQSPSPNGFSLPPGPRPRPVGGDSSPPGFSSDVIPSALNDELSHHLPPNKSVEQQLVIGSWNDECDKDDGVSSLPPLTAPPPSLPHSMSQPPPRLVGADQEWGGTFQMPRGGGHAWGAAEEFHSNDFKRHEDKFEADNFRGKRGGRGGGRGGQRGRGGFQNKPGTDHSREKVQGKSAAIEETKAMLAKMRLEDKELMSKNKKPGAGGDGADPEKPGVQPGAYRPRDNRRGRGDGDRRDGDRGGRGRGRGRGGMVPHLGPHQPPMMRMPFIPGDFRTPPFPGMDGFLPPGALQFPPHLPPGLFPLGMPDMRGGRGGFPRGGRGFPVGFAPRGFPPPMLGYRGRGGRGRGHPGGQRNKEFNKKDQVNNENPDNPMLSAIYVNNETEGAENKVEEELERKEDNIEETKEVENTE